MCAHVTACHKCGQGCLPYRRSIQKCFECIRYTADCVFQEILALMLCFFPHFKLCIFFFLADLSFFIVRPAIIKKNILMTQRAEGICVEKMDMPNLIKLCGVGGRGGMGCLQMQSKSYRTFLCFVVVYSF